MADDKKLEEVALGLEKALKPYPPEVRKSAVKEALDEIENKGKGRRMFKRLENRTQIEGDVIVDDQVGVLKDADVRLSDQLGRIRPSNPVFYGQMSRGNVLERAEQNEAALNSLDKSRLSEEQLDKLFGAQKRLGDAKGEFLRAWRQTGLVMTPKTMGDWLHCLLTFSDSLATSEEHEKEDFIRICRELLKNYDLNDHMVEFGLAWRESNFARVSVGHKTAAALMLTDVPEEMEVEAPWGSWFLEVPDGFYRFGIAREQYAVDVEELRTDEGTYRIRTTNEPGPGDIVAEVRGLFCNGHEADRMLVHLHDSAKSKNWFQVFKVSKHSRDVRVNFVNGVCLAFDRQFVKESKWGATTSKSKRRAKDPPDARKYILRRNITIDLRDEVKRVLSGKKRRSSGSSPTVQFLVRGHWRNQACGKGLQDRKRMWIEPYWKGPEEARVLLRGYNLKKKDDDDGKNQN